MRVSVLCPTMRVGGIDVLLHGLAQQTHRDFELVLSDALWKFRRDEVKAEADRLGVSVVHVEPRGLRFPLCTYCRHMNEAIVHATGELALLIVDYTWLAPDTIARHIAHHEQVPGSGFMGPHRYAELPPIDPRFPRYGHDPSETERYSRDVYTHTLDPLMLSIFERPLGEGDDPRLSAEDSSADIIGADGKTIRNRDPKLEQPAGRIHWGFLHCKNESVRLEHFVELNGFDEDLDGSHGWQDSDIACRLTEKCGIQWFVDPTMVVQIVNPRSVFPFGIRERPYQTNEQIWHKKMGDGHPPVNTWILREARKKLGRE